MRKRIGCLTNSGLVSAFVTLIIVTGLALVQGNQLFSPGALNAKAGNQLGGYVSHADIGSKCSLCHTAPWDAAHMSNRCVQCHVDVAAQLQDVNTLHGIFFKNNTRVTCRTCHPDHNGPDASLTRLDGINFPHDTLGFSLNMHKTNLDGKLIQCQDCHKTDFKNFSQQTCISCHEQMDAQFMQAHILAYASDCLACHDGLETYGKAFKHDSVAFKLTGKHVNLLCTQCHLNAHSKADLISTPQDCFTCHQKDDTHSGKFGSNCGICHSTDGWKPAKFDHNLANFKLEGKHIAVACEKCHIDGKYQGTPMDCAACHTKDDAHAGRFGTSCGSCHSANGWKPATFDHSLAAFPLTGKHASVPCEQCHVNNVYKGTPTDCYSCHAKNDKHNGSFGTNCGTCHSTSGWLPATFDHSVSGFPLTGAHLGLACTQCHPNNNFKGTSPACVSCHADPAFHAGSFGTDCASCHTTTNWNATYSGPHPSIGEHSGINHEGATCRDCHTVNLKTATCTKCHDSNNPGD